MGKKFKASKVKVKPKQKPVITRKTLYICAAILAVVILCTAAYFIYDLTVGQIVATVDGQKITVREFKRAMRANEPELYQYFADKHKVDGANLDMKKEYGGEVPYEVLKNMTLNDLKRIKETQILAKQKGVIDDISYSGYLKKLNDELERRETARKEDIVGARPTELTYFDVLFEDMEEELKKKLEEKELKYSDDDLKDYYESNKELSKNPDALKIQKVYVTRVEEDTMQKASDQLKDLRGRWDKGEDIKMLIKEFNKDSEFKFKFEDKLLDENAERAAVEDEISYELYRELRIESNKLSKGQVSEVLTGRDGSIYAVKLIDKYDDGYKDFGDNLGVIKTSYKDKKYEMLIDSMVVKAKVEVNDWVFNRIKSAY